MSNRGLAVVWVVVTLFQVFIALGLFVIAYSDTFGLERIAADGEKIVERLNQLEQRAGSQPGESQVAAAGQLRPLLQANNNAFRQLGKLAAWMGGALLVCALLQLGTLLLLTRQLTLSRKVSPKGSTAS